MKRKTDEKVKERRQALEKECMGTARKELEQAKEHLQEAAMDFQALGAFVWRDECNQMAALLEHKLKLMDAIKEIEPEFDRRS